MKTAGFNGDHASNESTTFQPSGRIRYSRKISSDGARKLQTNTALRVDRRSAKRGCLIELSTATAGISAPPSLRCRNGTVAMVFRLCPAKYLGNAPFGIGECRLGVLAPEHRVLEFRPERLLDLGVIGQRPVAGHLVGMFELG